MDSPKAKIPTWGVALICVGAAFLLLIVLAIAIPTFLGVHEVADSNDAVGTAANRAAQSDLNTALTISKAYYANHQTFAGMTPAVLQQMEPPLTFVGPTEPSTNADMISVGSVDQAALLVNRSSVGQCWYVLVVVEANDQQSPGLPTAPGTYFTSDHRPVCDAADLPAGPWTPNAFPLS
jgi:hypothetical protein